MSDQVLTFEEYLARLPLERRSEVECVWRLVRASVPADYHEQIGAKFLSFAAGDAQLVALANQKNYISLYLTPLYLFPHFKREFDAAASKSLKCGKGCITFRRADELPSEAIAAIISKCPDAASYRLHIKQMRNACK